MMELTDTATLMLSSDYKDRFRAEHAQAVIRYRRLKKMLEDWYAGRLDFEPACCRGIYNIQERAMSDYIAALEARAQIEGISLDE